MAPATAHSDKVGGGGLPHNCRGETVKLYIEVEGGIVTSVYGDDAPANLDIEIVVRDMDNIADGDEDPAPNGARDMTYYY